MILVPDQPVNSCALWVQSLTRRAGGSEAGMHLDPFSATSNPIRYVIVSIMDGSPALARNRA
jgi:hypothetical protein